MGRSFNEGGTSCENIVHLQGGPHVCKMVQSLNSLMTIPYMEEIFGGRGVRGEVGEIQFGGGEVVSQLAYEKNLHCKCIMANYRCLGSYSPTYTVDVVGS